MSYKATTITATGAQAALAKPRNENAVLFTVGGATFNLDSGFYVEASADGTLYEHVAVIDVKTGLLVAGGTLIAPSANSENSWVFPMAAGFTNVRLNCAGTPTGTATLKYFGQSLPGQALFNSVAGAAGSFTNITASGTLGVTGLTTLTGGSIVPDSVTMAVGTGADLLLSWDGTRFSFTQAATNSEMRYGVDGAGIDQRWYGDTASAYTLWDQSADSLIFGGVAGIQNLKVKQSTAVAITGATTLLLADSGGIFTVSQAAAYDIDLPSPTTGAGASYFFSLTAPGANNVTITVDGSAATFVGSIITEGQIVVATGSTLTFATGASLLGDSIEIRSIATNLYHVRAVASALNGITVS